MKNIIFVVLLYAIHLSPFAATDSVIFAGGCFWCMEPPFDKLDGVVRTTSGYSGGDTDNPAYKQVSSGETGHYEVIEIEYDPALVSYGELLEVYWANIDPFDDTGQFCDKGSQYRAAIFTKNETEKKLATESKHKLQEQLNGKARIVTGILSAKTFYPAEDYHQDYYMKNPLRYKYYRYSCGRDKRLKRVKALMETTETNQVGAD